jgi:glucose/arabinose dehydrogenase
VAPNSSAVAQEVPVPSRRLVSLAIAVVALSMVIPTATVAAPTVTPRVVQNGLVIPWDVAFAPGGQMFVSERPGRIRVFASGGTNAALLATTTITSVRAQGEAGVMGIALHRRFSEHRLLYVCASRTDEGQWRNQVLRYRVRANWTLDPDGYIIRRGMLANTIHNGCAVEHGPDGKLWVSMGDANLAGRAQDPDLLNGKILRVKAGGGIPADNPVWPGHSRPSRVYSIGHRNPQGIAFSPGTERVYAPEHGPDRDDEVNWIRAGRNYGWPCVTGTNNPVFPRPAGCPSGTSGFTLPAWSSEGPTLATSNGVFLTGKRWDTWRGHLVVATLKQSDLRRFSFELGANKAHQRAVMFDGFWGRLRSTVLGPGGQLYVTTSNGSNDKVIRITATAP